MQVQQNSERKLIMSIDKEKVLAAARNDKYRGQEYENKETMRSSLVSCLITLIIGSGLFLLEYFVKDSVNVGLIAVGLTFAGVDSLYEGVKLKRLHMTILGAFMSLCAIVAILHFVFQVVLV